MKTLRFLLAWPVSQALYGLGCVASWLLTRLEGDGDVVWGEIPWHFTAVFRVYQWLMISSSHVDEWGDAGLWTLADDEEAES